MSEVEQNIPQADTGATQTDAPVPNVDSRTEDQMLADILRTSDFTKDLYPEADDVPAPEGTPEVDDQVPQVDDEVVDTPVESEVPVEDDTSTQDIETYTLDDLEDFNVMVKIDGEEQAVNITELVKGYQTDQSLSQKGRELGDARKQLDEEKASKIAEIDNVLGAASRILAQSEEKFATEYHDLNSQIETAREEGDTFLINELKDKRDVAQEKYWNARSERESMIQQANSQKAEIQQQEWNSKLQHFGENISKVIPDWSEEIAVANREFALSKGIPQDFLSNMVDINVIKFVDDYRRAEEARSKGAIKREAAPVRATPVKKSPTISEKQEVANSEMREKVLSGQGSSADNDAFLRNLAARHFEQDPV